MERIIADIRLNEIKVYIVSDEYIRTCYSKTKNDVKKNLIEYLNGGAFINILLNSTKSIFNNNDSITSNETLLSDGNWIWSGDLNYYTENYDFKWPKEFFETIKANCYEIEQMDKYLISHLEAICFDIKRTVFKEDWRNDEIFSRPYPILKYKIISI